MSASPESVSMFQDDTLSLVQAQYEVSGVIFNSDNPVEVLRAIHKFSGGRFSSGHLAYALSDSPPVSLRIVAEGSPSVVRTADRLAGLDDYPGEERLAAYAPIFISDLTTDTTVTEAERQRLRGRSVRAALVMPLVIKQRLTGLLALFHTDPVSLAPTQLRALGNVADQLAVVLENRRLLEAAHASTVQAQTINALVTRFQSATSVDELLRMTLTELGQALGAERGAIRVGSIEAIETGGTAHD